MDPLSQQRKKWRRRGFTVSRQSDPAGKRWATHTHAVDEIVELVAGTIEVKVGANTRRPKVGTEVVVPRHTPHAIHNPGSVRADYFYGFKTKT